MNSNLHIKRPSLGSSGLRVGGIWFTINGWCCWWVVCRVLVIHRLLLTLVVVVVVVLLGDGGTNRRIK